MSKHRHSKDRMFITNRIENDYLEWGGKKDAFKVPLSKLPFDCCSLSLEPFKNPVCTQEGHVFDIINIVPFIKKYKKNPITGAPLRFIDLIKLNFHKTEKGEYHDPISFKVFTDFTKIVAIRTSGNVFTSDTVEELNRKPKHWVDLLTGEQFTYKDIITLQDPNNIQQRTVKDFDFLRNNLKFDPANKEEANQITQFMNLSDSAKQILQITGERDLERKQKEEQNDRLKIQEGEEVHKKVRLEVESGRGMPVQEWLDYASKSGLFISERYSTSHDAFSVTCTQSSQENNSGNLRYRNMTSDEIRKILYDEVRRSKEKGYVQLVLNQGSINLEIHADSAPMTSENFLELCEKGYYNNTKFHKLQENVLIEGGDPTGTGYGGESIFGKPFRNEINNKLSHNKAGILSMANLGPEHNTSQFFITLSEQKEKDGKYSCFGEVVGGYQVLYKINKITTNMWERPDYNIRILETKVFKNPFRESCKKLLKLKDLEQDETYQLTQKSKHDERWIDEKSKFELPGVQQQDYKPKGLGLAQNLINSFSNESTKQTPQGFNFDNWK